MCGIFGYSGKGRTTEELLNGLARLEYRGYDSCGIAGIKKQGFFLHKRAGKIAPLRQELKSAQKEIFSTAILHTRWATHGKPSFHNAHPHRDCHGEIALVHNGIIENYLELKEELIKEGHHFVSETDTEVIAHVIEKFYKDSLEEAVRRAIKKLKGTFALGVISRREPDKLVGVRKASPLIVGIEKHGAFLASDILAILPFSKEVIYLADEQIVVLEKGKARGLTFEGKPIPLAAETVRLKAAAAEKKGFAHFMLKEIFEQPAILRQMFSLYVKKGKILFPDVTLSREYLKNVKRIYITACGTAYHAGLVGKYFLEKHCDVHSAIDTSSEFRYRNTGIKKGDLLIAISQSGETADTLAAVREAKNNGATVLSVCNVLGSSLVKESDSMIYTLAGPEIGVASTKAYTAQVFSLFLFALYLKTARHSGKETNEMIQELGLLSAYVQKILDEADKIKKIAGDFSQFGCFLFLGRGINFPSALEGALKLKEISYIPAEGYAAGEMKHGPIALIDEYRGVVCVAPHDALYEKMVSNMQEIKARKGKTLGILNPACREAILLSDEAFFIPSLKQQDFSPLLAGICLQLFAYYVAKNRKCEIDQPRNLAKSVTVE